MVQINFARKELTAKIVYYGPVLGGKRNNLEILWEKQPPGEKGGITRDDPYGVGDYTYSLECAPPEPGTVGGLKVRLHLCTVGACYYNATHKALLQGADGIIFVVDSKKRKIQENIDCFKNLEENLREQGLELEKMPHVIQYNKRDLPDAATVAELDKAINKYGAPTFEAVVKTGEGVYPPLKKLWSMIHENLVRAYGQGRKR